MATLEEFKALRDGVPAEVQAELYRLFTADPEASYKQMDEDEEFDDFELDAVALAAIAGGWGRRKGC